MFWTVSPLHLSFQVVAGIPQLAYANYCGPVIYIYIYILAGMDKQEINFLILIDLSAAFDPVKHRPLINILDNDFGTAGVVRKWFESCLA